MTAATDAKEESLARVLAALGKAIEVEDDFDAPLTPRELLAIVHRADYLLRERIV